MGARFFSHLRGKALVTQPLDCPEWKNERLHMVWLGTDANHSSDTAKALASPFRTGRASGPKQSMMTL